MCNTHCVVFLRNTLNNVEQQNSEIAKCQIMKRETKNRDSFE